MTTKLRVGPLKKLFSSNSPIKYDLSIEGQRVEGDQFVVGPWAGPEAEIGNLAHEICHFAEREIEKLLLFPPIGWGFSMGRYWEIAGHSGWEPDTDQQVRRERRVWAYQVSLMRHFALDVDPEDLAGSAVYLPAWCYYKPKGTRCKGDLSAQDRQKIKRLGSEIERMSQNEYTYEAFIAAWNRRIEVLSEHLSKKPV